MNIDVAQTHETWQFDLSEREGGLIAIMLQEEESLRRFEGDLEHGIVDITQSPFTMFGAIYPTYVIQIDTGELKASEFTRDEVIDSIKEFARQMVERAERFYPEELSIRGYWHTNYYNQRKAVESHIQPETLS